MILPLDQSYALEPSLKGTMGSSNLLKDIFVDCLFFLLLWLRHGLTKSPKVQVPELSLRFMVNPLRGGSEGN